MFKKTWVSPSLAILYLVTSITGVLLFFHVHNGAIITLHEWMGMGFLALGGVHLWLNWKVFVAYFKKKAAIRGTVAVLIATLVFTMIGGFGHNDRGNKKLTHSRYDSHRSNNH